MGELQLVAAVVSAALGAWLHPGVPWWVAAVIGVIAVVVRRPWLVIVWNDPVNLMSYVTFVLQKLFGYSRAKAEKMMLDVHHKGKAIVTSGARERMEYDASRLQAYGLWATVDQP